MSLINYTEKMIELGVNGSEGLIKAQGNDKNVLLLRKLDDRIKRADGKLAGYELEHRWLNAECENEDDEAFVCVMGSDLTYWQRKEIKVILDNKDSNLFDHFNLF